MCCYKTLCLSGLPSADPQVLDSGRLREYDEPYVLLQNPESLFYKMVQQLGKGEAAALTETAKQVSSPRSPNYGVSHQLPPRRWHQGSGKEHRVPFSIISLWRQSCNTSRVEVRSTRTWQERQGGEGARAHACASGRAEEGVNLLEDAVRFFLISYWYLTHWQWRCCWGTPRKLERVRWT